VRNLFGHVLEAESATRGYLLTHNSLYLGDREVVDRAEAELSRIERLTKDNSRQEQSVKALRPLVQGKLDFLKRVTDLQNEKSAAEARTAFCNQ
jgi:CHASE3 domain sensor protein